MARPLAIAYLNQETPENRGAILTLYRRKVAVTHDWSSIHGFPDQDGWFTEDSAEPTPILQRPLGVRLLSQVQRGDAILFHDAIPEIATSVREVIEYLKYVNHFGIIIWFHSFFGVPLEFPSRTGNFAMHLLVNAYRTARRHKGPTLKAARQRLHRREVPEGMRRENGKLIRDEPFWELIRYFMAIMDSKHFTYQGLAQWVNFQRYSHPQRRPWTAERLERLLQAEQRRLREEIEVLDILRQKVRNRHNLTSGQEEL